MAMHRRTPVSSWREPIDATCGRAPTIHASPDGRLTYDMRILSRTLAHDRCAPRSGGRLLIGVTDDDVVTARIDVPRGWKVE